jgi:hypothetical protein
MRQPVTLFLFFLALGAMAAAAPYQPGQTRDEPPGALVTNNLASDTEWTLKIDNTPPRRIKVPAGGYNSDLQDEPLIAMCNEPGYSVDKSGIRNVTDCATYERKITVPKVCDGQVTLVEFGAVNHGADVYLVDKTNAVLVASHAGPHMPFAANLTGVTEPGKEYTLRVKTYPLWHYTNTVPVGFVYLEGWLNANKRGQWTSKFGFGITKYVRIAVYPPVRMTDVFIRTSVARDEWKALVAIQNDSPVVQTLNLGANFSSWNGDPWKYPDIPAVKITVPAKSKTRVTLGPVTWGLGSNSFWWPNKPFREDYIAKLHTLSLELRASNNVVNTRSQRFGFVEWGEGPFYYTVNGVRINFIADSTPEAAMSDYDCYSTAPAFLPPTGPNTGCPETWKRYMRMGINVNRTHQSTPTQYMMDAADETGFMLIPETPIRGCQLQLWSDEYLPASMRELALFCRNHPSVCRYSVHNEAKPNWVPDLIDAAMAVDDTRPLVFEDNQVNRPIMIRGTLGHAYAMLHYTIHPRPATLITGVGEIAWANWEHLGDGPEVLAYLAYDGRVQNAAYYCGWDWINYWPNFLEGMSMKRHAWRQEESWHDDRVDKVNGWDSPVMRHIQKMFDPYLVADNTFIIANGPFSTNWPEKMSSYNSGNPIERKIVIFNDSLQGDQFELKWTARWDTPSGPPITNGVIPNLKITPGFHDIQIIAFQAPTVNKTRQISLTLESYKEGRLVFSDDRTILGVSPKDDKTTGD